MIVEIHRNPSSTQAMTMPCLASDAVPDMTQVTASMFRIRRDVDGTTVDRVATISDKTAAGLTMTYQFADGSDFQHVGTYEVWPVHTVGGKPIQGQPTRINVKNEWETLNS